LLLRELLLPEYERLVADELRLADEPRPEVLRFTEELRLVVLRPAAALLRLVPVLLRLTLLARGVVRVVERTLPLRATVEREALPLRTEEPRVELREAPPKADREELLRATLWRPLFSGPKRCRFQE